MVKPKGRFIERRRYIRLQTPINIAYILPGSGRIYNTVAKNISADGLRLETMDKAIKESDIIELKLDMPGAANPVHAKSRVIWKSRISLEDGAPFDMGLEFSEIEEDNKNTFLKFLCDLIYNLTKEFSDA